MCHFDRNAVERRNPSPKNVGDDAHIVPFTTCFRADEGIRPYVGQENRAFVSRVWDTYNFNIGNEKGDGVSSWLNNMDYTANQIGIGTNYNWEVNYVHKTRWIPKNIIRCNPYGIIV